MYTSCPMTKNVLNQMPYLSELIDTVEGVAQAKGITRINIDNAFIEGEDLYIYTAFDLPGTNITYIEPLHFNFRQLVERGPDYLKQRINDEKGKIANDNQL